MKLEHIMEADSRHSRREIIINISFARTNGVSRVLRTWLMMHIAFSTIIEHALIMTILKIHLGISQRPIQSIPLCYESRQFYPAETKQCRPRTSSIIKAVCTCRIKLSPFRKTPPKAVTKSHASSESNTCGGGHPSNSKE